MHPFFHKTCHTTFSRPSVTDINSLGVSADYKEATAFAVLGSCFGNRVFEKLHVFCEFRRTFLKQHACLCYLRLRGVPANLPETTGAEKSCLLGTVFE